MTKVLSEDARDFVEMIAAHDPELGALVRGRLERGSDSENALRAVAAMLTAASRMSGGWLIGRFG